MGSLSSWWLAQLVDDLDETEKWLTLVSDDPEGAVDPLTVEIIGGTLTRHESLWSRTPLLLTIDSAVVFSGIPVGAHVAGIACFNADFNGDLLASDLFDTPVDYPSGGTWVLPAGEFAMGFLPPAP